jgi:hypothetical protein
MLLVKDILNGKTWQIIENKEKRGKFFKCYADQFIKLQRGGAFKPESSMPWKSVTKDELYVVWDVLCANGDTGLFFECLQTN